VTRLIVERKKALDRRLRGEERDERRERRDAG